MLFTGVLVEQGGELQAAILQHVSSDNKNDIQAFQFISPVYLAVDSRIYHCSILLLPYVKILRDHCPKR